MAEGSSKFWLVKKTDKKEAIDPDAADFDVVDSEKSDTISNADTELEYFRHTEIDFLRKEKLPAHTVRYGNRFFKPPHSLQGKKPLKEVMSGVYYK